MSLEDLVKHIKLGYDITFDKKKKLTPLKSELIGKNEEEEETYSNWHSSCDSKRSASKSKKK